MEGMIGGLELLMHWEPILFLFVGLVIGFFVGALPGFDSANAVALLLPFSIALSTESALILMATVFVGSQVAGAIPAILLNVPGTAGAAATALDGYPLNQQGKGTLAIGIGRAASTAGALVGGLIVLALVGPFSTMALTFQSPETFLVALFGLLVIGSVSGADWLKGLLAGFAGVLIALMSASVETAVPRMTFGYPELYGDVPFVPAVVGLFGVAQMLVFLAERRTDMIADTSPVVPRGASALVSRAGQTVRRDIREAIEGVRIAAGRPFNILRSALIGVFIGCVPGVGTSVANFVSYGEARRASKHPESFGQGNPDGVIAAEACDNAACCGTMVPTLTLGIPGSSTAAIMLAALYLHGIQPGPRVMVTHQAEAYAVLIAIVVAGVFLLPIGIVLSAPLIWISRVPDRYLVPGVLMICLVGSFALRNSVFDMGLMIIFGGLGFAMRMGGVPVIPMVLGLILGPIAESNFMRSLRLSRNDPMIFAESWTSRVLLLMIVLLVTWNLYASLRGRTERRRRALLEG